MLRDTPITGHSDGDHSQIVRVDQYFCPIIELLWGQRHSIFFLLRPRKEVVYGSAVISRW
jgi:hypothetical protein